MKKIKIQTIDNMKKVKLLHVTGCPCWSQSWTCPACCHADHKIL